MKHLAKHNKYIHQLIKADCFLKIKLECLFYYFCPWSYLGQWNKNLALARSWTFDSSRVLIYFNQSLACYARVLQYNMAGYELDCINNP